MLGEAGNALGLEFTFLDPSPNPPAARVGEVISSPFDRSDGLARLAARSDIVTYEFENVAVDAVERLALKLPVLPPAAALKHAQDRLDEKRLFEALEIPLPGYRPVDTAADLQSATGALGFPIVLKTRRLGYDGKGQAVLRSPQDVDAAWRQLGDRSLVAEQWVPFDREVSAIGARRANGDVATYPLTENRHSDGILCASLAPFESGTLTELATDYLQRLLNRLDYVGVLALELFVVGDRLLANEFAPRVHNSGHWTIEGTACSQFENHLRAILDMPLGDAGATGYAGMVNLIGTIPDQARQLRGERLFLHDYGKQPRPGRKLGHVTVVADGPGERDSLLMKVKDALGHS